MANTGTFARLGASGDVQVEQVLVWLERGSLGQYRSPFYASLRPLLVMAKQHSPTVPTCADLTSSTAPAETVNCSVPSEMATLSGVKV